MIYAYTNHFFNWFQLEVLWPFLFGFVCLFLCTSYVVISVLVLWPATYSSTRIYCVVQRIDTNSPSTMSVAQSFNFTISPTHQQHIRGPCFIHEPSTIQIHTRRHLYKLALCIQHSRINAIGECHKLSTSGLMCFWSGRDRAINSMHNKGYTILGRKMVWQFTFNAFLHGKFIQLNHVCNVLSTDSCIYD